MLWEAIYLIALKEYVHNIGQIAGTWQLQPTKDSVLGR